MSSFLIWLGLSGGLVLGGYLMGANAVRLRVLAVLRRDSERRLELLKSQPTNKQYLEAVLEERNRLWDEVSEVVS